MSWATTGTGAAIVNAKRTRERTARQEQVDPSKARDAWSCCWEGGVGLEAPDLTNLLGSMSSLGWGRDSPRSPDDYTKHLESN